jgi:Fic family protein
MENKKFVSWIFKKQYDYESFLPNKINSSFTWEDPEINILLEKANLELGKLESFSNFIPDIDFFISMHIWKEAIESSKIEGTKTEFDDLFLEQDLKEEEKDDLIEVRNYIDALNYWIDNLKKLPLSFRLFSEIHKILLSGVRWERKTPWEIRKSQNWIWWSNLKTAFFIPPHIDDLWDLIKDFELFLHNKDLKIPELIKIALAHYQFETIHPYLDWNGRIWRLLITLYFIDKKILTKPVLYLSYYLEQNRWAYYDALTMVRNGNNIEHWLKFFLNWIIETCDKSITTLNKILELKKNTEIKILSLWTRTEKAWILLRELFSNPIVSASLVTKKLKISPTTANIFLKKFIELWILQEITWMKKNKLFIFEDYIKLFR